MKIDNFAISNFMACPAKYKLRMVDGWESRRKSGALNFGAALHLGLAEWYRSGSSAAAVKAIVDGWPTVTPIDDYRTREKCVQTMCEYIKTYPDEGFTIIGKEAGSPLIENAFTLDTGMFLPCPCGQDKSDRFDPDCSYCFDHKESLEYGGILDAGVEFSGSVYILEHKSTSQLGPYYFDQFRPNNQITGYTWALGLLSGMRVGGAIVNAIGVYKSQPTKFQRQITNRSNDDIKAWLLNLWHVCVQIKTCERTGYWPMYTTSCMQYGKCEFHSVHVLGNAIEQQRRLENDFQTSKWDYEARDE